MGRSFGALHGSLRRAVSTQGALRYFPYIPYYNVDYDAQSVGEFGAPYGLSSQNFSFTSQPTGGYSTYNPVTGGFQAASNQYDVQAAQQQAVWAAGGQVAASGVSALISGIFGKAIAKEQAKAAPAIIQAPPSSAGLGAGATIALVLGGVGVLGLGLVLLLKD
jgi:hypothetical protein